MANIKDTITELIKKIFQYKVSEIIEKEGGLYVMIDVDAPVSQKIAQDIERKILDELSIKIIVCFIQNKITHKNKKLKQKVPGVKKIILVCSGKGGVGKSSISANIAYYLSLAGHKVGLFDADIYGPSIQKIFGVDEEVQIKNDSFIPPNKMGIKLMSMGFIVNSGDALVWRGPMVTKTLNNMLMHTDWSHKNLIGIRSELDYLVIDTPPGTGDVHLSLAENYIIDGAVVVSTPQDIALSNAHRSVDMLQKLNIRVLGMIENMAYLVNPDGSKNYVFGTGNIAKYANANGLNLLATIPLMPEMSKSFDVGNVVGDFASEDFKELCEALRRLL
jgi:ATP-binding protein involved in chromosome partitioning